MYTADVCLNPETVRPIILAAGRLEIQTMINAIMREVLRWEIERMESGTYRFTALHL